MLLNHDLKIMVALCAALLVYGMLWLFMKNLSRARRQKVLSRYSELRKQSLELQKITSNYMMSADTSNVSIRGDVTYADFYRQLKQKHVSNLSDKCLQKIKYSNNLLLLKKAEHTLHNEEIRLQEARLLISYAFVG